MQRWQLLRGAFATSWALAACTGFDPSKLFPARPEPDDAGAAGWSYDADSTAGRGASAVRGTGGTLSDGSFHGGGGGRELSAGSANDTEQTPARGSGSSGGEAGTLTAGEGGASGAAADAGGGVAVAGHGGGGARGGVGSGGAHGGAGSHAAGGSSRGGSSQGGAAGVGRGGTGGHGGSGGHASGGASGSASGGAPSTTSAGSANGGSAGTANGGPRTLWFSEYVEGSGKYKALEIAGPPGTPLSGCEIATYSNGATVPGTLALDAVLGAAGAYVLCSSSLADVAGVHCDRSTNLSFNGNDAVALVCDGVTLDVIGEIGVDPGVGWTDGSVSTANSTLRRRCGITPGDADGTGGFDPALEWLASPVDTVDGLGDPACE